MNLKIYNDYIFYLKGEIKAQRRMKIILKKYILKLNCSV